MNNLVEEIVEKNGDWYDDTESESESSLVTEYDISISPNDFNIRTLYDFIESGAIVIPDFQRHFVWDRPRASKLIESLIRAIPESSAWEEITRLPGCQTALSQSRL